MKSLVLIGTPHKVPKIMFSIQNVIFRLLPKSTFKGMAFNKKDTFILGNTMKELDFSHKVNVIKCPTLIICGDKDNLNIIKQTGHVVNEENPKELARILNDYYDGN